MSEKKTVNDYITKFRPELMGLAILWIVWFHSSLSPAIFPWRPVSVCFLFIKAIGYCGADIFLFLSGYGIARSLARNSTSQFAKNRAKKILPIWLSYLPVFLILVTCFFNGTPTITEILGHITFTGFWLEMSYQGNWYVFTIVLFYLLSPMLYLLFKKARVKSRMCMILMCIAFLISFLFFGKTALIAFSRLPIYIFGMYVFMDKKDVSVGTGHILICLMSLITGVVASYLFMYFFPSYLWTFGLWWYPSILIAPALTILLTVLFDKIKTKCGALLWSFRKFGSASLEILLVSDFFFDYVYPSDKLTFVSGQLRNWLIFILSFVIALIYHKIIEVCKSRCTVFLAKKKTD